MTRSLGLLNAMFNGSGACALGSLGLLGSLGCEETVACEEFDACEELDDCEKPPFCDEPGPEFGPLPVLLPGSGGGGWTSESVSCPAGPTCSRRQSFPVNGSR